MFCSLKLSLATLAALLLLTLLPARPAAAATNYPSLGGFCMARYGSQSKVVSLDMSGMSVTCRNREGFWSVKIVPMPAKIKGRYVIIPTPVPVWNPPDDRRESFSSVCVYTYGSTFKPVSAQGLLACVSP